MNITPIELYWLTRLDAFASLFGAVILVLVLLVIVNVAGGFIAMDDAYMNRVLSFGDKEVSNADSLMRRRFTRALKIGVSAFLLGLAGSFVPSTKQMAAIVIIPKIANSESVAEISDAAREMIGLARDWMRTLAPKNNKE